MSTDTLTQQLATIDDQLKNPLPTPHVGCNVLWYAAGKVEPDNQRAAIVTAIEGAGKVTLTIFPPNGMPQHKKGVHFLQHPAMLAKTHDHAKIHNGVWNYCDNSTSRKTHYEYHTEELKRKLEAVLDAKRQQVDASRAKSDIAKQSAPENQPA